METLQELLIEELKDIYSAEKQLIKAMPKMVKGAQSQALKAAFSEHLEVTKEQVVRLEAAFTAAGSKAKAKQCKGMEGLLLEGSECLEEEASGFRDLQLISAAQRIEHYEISAYGTALSIAEQCGLQECADLLAETLEEEEAADEALMAVAEGLYGELAGQAAPAEDSEEEEDDDQIIMTTDVARSALGNSLAKKPLKREVVRR